MRRSAINLIGNQLVWLCAVAGAARGWQWPALLAAAFYIASQLSVAAQMRVELRLVMLSLLCAFLVDGTAAASRSVQYAAAPWGALPPPWILALWAAFAMTLTSSMRFLQRHMLLAVAFGALLAPLAYLSAAHAFNAVEFAEPAWRGVVVLGLGWSVALPLLCVAARRWSGTIAFARSAGAPR